MRLAALLSVLLLNHGPLRAAVPSCRFTPPLFDQIEGPGYPQCAYIGVCFTNCAAVPGSPFTEANAYIRVAQNSDGTDHYDCATQCRWDDAMPRIPLPPGFTPSRSICPAGQASNVENYAWRDASGSLVLGADAGCSLP